MNMELFIFYGLMAYAAVAFLVFIYLIIFMFREMRDSVREIEAIDFLAALLLVVLASVWWFVVGYIRLEKQSVNIFKRKVGVK